MLRLLSFRLELMNDNHLLRHHLNRLNLHFRHRLLQQQGIEFRLCKVLWLKYL
jgi:hypothetical protein